MGASNTDLAAAMLEIARAVVPDIRRRLGADRGAILVTTLGYLCFAAERALPSSSSERDIARFRENVTRLLAKHIAPTPGKERTLAAAIDDRRLGFFESAAATLGGNDLAQSTYFRASVTTRRTSLRYGDVGPDIGFWERMEDEFGLTDAGRAELAKIRENPDYVGVESNVMLDLEITQLMSGLDNALAAQMI